MSFIEALFLGALQGVTEFLPVSSSGHLVIAREFMEIRNIPLIFDVLLHISTLLVVILVFRKRILRLLVSFFRMLTGKKTDEEERGTILAILVATVLTGLIGIGIQSFSPGEHPRLTGAPFLPDGSNSHSSTLVLQAGRRGGSRSQDRAHRRYRSGVGGIPGHLTLRYYHHRVPGGRAFTGKIGRVRLPGIHTGHSRGTDSDSQGV